MARRNNKIRQDIESNKILLLICMAFCAALVLMFLYRGFSTAGRAAVTYNISLGICIASALSFIFCLYWFFKNRKSHTTEEHKVITSSNCLITSAVLLASALFVYKMDIRAIKALYVLLPIYVTIYFVFRVYGACLAFITCTCAANGLVFYYLSSRLGADSPRAGLYLTLFALLCAGEVVACFFLRSRPGISVSRSDMILALISSFLPLVFLVLWFFMHSTAMGIGLFAVGGWWLVCATYYTVELMKH